MNEMENNVYHSTADVWKVVTEQGKDIGALKSGFAELRVRVDGGFASISNQIAGVIAAVDKVSEQAVQDRMFRKPDTRGWVVAILGMLAVVGSIGLLVVQPMQVEIQVQEQRQWTLGQRAAYVEGYMDALEKMGHYPHNGGRIAFPEGGENE